MNTSAENASDDPGPVMAEAFDAVAEEYAALEVQEWPRLRRLREVLTDLPPGSAVLDLGCGSAMPAGTEIVQDHVLTGVDISWRQIALARGKLPEATFIEADIVSVQFPPGSYDAVVSFYAFDAIPRHEWAPLLKRIWEWLRPGGHLLLAVEDADEKGKFGTWLGVRSYFSSFDAQTTRRLVAAQGFEIVSADVETQEEMYRREAPAKVPYTWIRARRGVDCNAQVASRQAAKQPFPTSR